MKIHEIIREHRIAKGLTQEQVASYLGVSAPAVNKWEKAISYPDITLLPPLARLLDTDMNTLLSFKEELSRREIGGFLNEAASDAVSNGVSHAFSLIMDKIHEYPSCDLLILNAAVTLDGLVAMDTKEEDTDGLMNEVERLYERAARSADKQIGDQAKAMLATTYMAREEYDRAERLLTELPDESFYDKKQLQVSLCIRQERWEEAARLTEHKLLSELNRVQSSLQTLMDIAVKEKRLEDANKIADIASRLVKLFDMWEYGSYVAHFQLSLLEKDVPKCLAILEKMLSSMLANWDTSDSPLYRHVLKKENSNTIGEKMMPKLLSEFEDPENHEYNFLQSNPDFQKLIAGFKEMA